MAGELTVPVQSFEERMRERIKKDIGELLTNEELSKMIQRSMEDIFFNERPNPSYNGWSGERKIAPLLHSIVKELMAQKVDAAVNKWLNEHPVDIATALESTMAAGVGQCVIHAINSYFAGAFLEFTNSIKESLKPNG